MNMIPKSHIEIKTSITHLKSELGEVFCLHFQPASFTNAHLAVLPFDWRLFSVMITETNKNTLLA